MGRVFYNNVQMMLRPPKLLLLSAVEKMHGGQGSGAEGTGRMVTRSHLVGGIHGNVD